MRTPEQQKHYEIVRERIWDFICDAISEDLIVDEVVDAILSIPSIAVVDENQELPENPWYPVTSGQWLGCDLAYRDMVNANWWKVISKE